MLYNEFFIPFPKKKNNKDDKEAMEKLANDLRTTKENISNLEPVKFYEQHKKIINVAISVLIGWVQYGAILGIAAIPFALTLTFLTFVMKRTIKLIKTEADKNFVVENLKIEISTLMNIKKNNKENKVMVEKIDRTIDITNEMIDKLLDS